MTEKQLPVIDLRLAHGHTRPALVADLREALGTVGFIYLTGIDYDEEELLRLTKWFFAIPLKERMKISNKTFNPSCDYEYRGFFPVIPGAVSHKEAIEIGPNLDPRPQPPSDDLNVRIFFEDNQWPDDPSGDPNAAKYFRKWMENYHEKMTEASLELLRLIAEGLGGPTEFFTPLFKDDHLSTLRLLHYPLRSDPPESAIDGKYVIQTAEHNDTGMITLLVTFKEYPGLQVRWWEDDSFLDVPYRKGHLVVNIGKVLASMSGGRLKATRHRIVDVCGDRLSVPFFLEPKYGGNINVALPGGVPQLGFDPKERVDYGPWLFRNMTRFVEYKDLIDRVVRERTSRN